MSDENRNFILAAVLCVVVLVGWQYFFIAPPEPAQDPATVSDAGGAGDRKSVV